MAYLRVAAGVVVAALFVAVAAPLAVLARRAGSRRGAAASVALHRWLCLILGVRWRRLGTPGPERRLIVANHVSWLDILVLGAMEPMAFLAKQEVGSSPWTRWLVDLQGVVYIDRGRKRGIPSANAAIAQRLRAGMPTTLFAEATTSDGTRLLPYRASHFEAARQAEALVQPVYLDYRAISGVCVTRQEKALVAWYGDMKFLASLRRILVCGGVRCDVYYGAPIAFDDARDRKALAHLAEAETRRLRAHARRGGGP